MHMTTLAKALAVWLLLVVLAILNGSLRESLLVPSLGSAVALPLSGVSLSAAIFLVAWFTTPRFGCSKASGYWFIGLFWVSLTLLFEFVFGHFVRHKGWLELLGAYTFRGGNLWPVVLVVTLIAPRLAARLRGPG
jgi:hypothetical protein